VGRPVRHRRRSSTPGHPERTLINPAGAGNAARPAAGATSTADATGTGSATRTTIRIAAADAVGDADPGTRSLRRIFDPSTEFTPGSARCTDHSWPRWQGSAAQEASTPPDLAFFDLLLKQSPQPNFEPGTYKLEQQMSSKSALAGLLDPKNRVVSKVVIPEGDTMEQFFTRLSSGTGVPVADFEAASKNYVALGVPASAPSLEGYLFPATYDFNPGTDATTILKTLVARMYQSLNADGVAPADRQRVLTLASIVQKEGGSTPDFYKVARVFQNRLDQHMLLQSDATVSYGAHSSSISTTSAQRADASNLYNTYVHPGLPIGPIASPGDAAIKAALKPAAGSWLYFVLVNGDTKQTVFSDTLAEHNVAVKQWQAWLKAHPGYDN
jgi:UPF0755 protein